MCKAIRLSAWPREPSQSLFDQHPQLLKIWAPELAAIAAQHTLAWETNADESGEIFVAQLDDVVVGIAGWYRMNRIDAGLRWLGVVPEARRRGYAGEMIDRMTERLPPDVCSLYEVTRNPASKAFFARCGFAVVTDPLAIQQAVDHAEYDIANGGWVLRRAVRSPAELRSTTQPADRSPVSSVDR
jgi:RimJ/RimL family protein N-acetyltransferase